MRKLVVLLAVVLGMLATSALPAGAITGNYVEDFEHPFVGLVVFYDENGEFSHRCSGSLLSPSVFLTAGHCTDGATTARVYFQQDAGANYDPETQVDPVSGYPEYCAEGTLGVTCATSGELYNYGFDDFESFPNTKDVGLVILDQPITMPEYGVLAAAGSLDELDTRRGHQELTFTSSGYGLSESNPVHVTSFRERLMAESRLTNLRSHNTDGFNLQTNGNGSGRGGTCSGDSGGPVFYGGFESNTIVAVTSFGMNAYCRGVDFSYRTDRQEVIDWIIMTVEDSTASDEADDIQIVSL
ncbi:MAG: trypsin-like serine protease [Actinomycetota bacterium]|nr:trypsin-like serine protease [Rubrobacteraceae bacterium]MDQ3497324.1 trypsin-like serine protease [Actinomycetota bacterium]